VTKSRAALVLLLALAGVLLGVAPAQAARTVTIELTADGPKPASVTVTAGDTVEFLNTDPTFVHGAQSKSTNWTFDTQPLPPGARARAGTLSKAGTYTYESTNTLEQFSGRVVVPGTTATAPSPARSAVSTPSRPPASSPAASPGAATPAPSASPTGGSGVVGPPLISGGLPSAAPTEGGPAPDVAPVLPGGEGEQSPEPAGSAGPAVAVSPGRLAEPATARRYGLPAALAAVAAAGVVSLLVRLLLAHPAARGRRRPGPAVTVR
jgi:plastocyanin